MIKSSVNIHSWAYFVSLTLIAISIPLSKFMMSITEFILIAIWLLSGFSFRISHRFYKLGGFFKGVYYQFVYLLRLAANNFVDKFGLFFKNRAAMVLTSIYFLHLIGLIYSEDMDYAMKDLRIKLPILLFPIVLSTMESFNYRKFRILLLFYVAAVFAGSLISLGLILKGDFTDIRLISPFIGSIRFGLNVSFSFFILVYFLLADKGFNIWQKLLFLIVAIWFIIFLVLMESVTSLSIILLISVGYLIWQSLKTKYIILRLAIIVAAVGIPLFVSWYVWSVVEEVSHAPQVEVGNLDQVTVNGNLYIHDTIGRGVENGKYIGLYICAEELKQAWNQRSNLDYNGLTEGGHQVNETLIRYLTSKDLRKDADGIMQLTDWDIGMVEQGVANYEYLKYPGIRTRIMKILMGYEVYLKNGDPSGSSVMQRIEYSKASISLIKKNFWFGVGTGDIENQLIDQYNRINSGLKSEYMFHAHNQFFAIFITFGVFGFLWFVFALFYPPAKTARFGDYFFLTFFLIIIWSMLSDDTLETQAGATLFAFFMSLLLFGKKKENARIA